MVRAHKYHYIIFWLGFFACLINITYFSNLGAEDNDSISDLEADYKDSCEEELAKTSNDKDLTKCFPSVKAIHEDGFFEQFSNSQVGEWRIILSCKDTEENITDRGAYWYIRYQCKDKDGKRKSYKVYNPYAIGSQIECQDDSYDISMLDLQVMVCNSYNHSGRIYSCNNCNDKGEFCGPVTCKPMKIFLGSLDFNHTYRYDYDIVKSYSTQDGGLVSLIRQKNLPDHDRETVDIKSLGYSDTFLETQVYSKQGTDRIDAEINLISIWENKFSPDKAYYKGQLVDMSYDEDNDVLMINSGDDFYKVEEEYRLCMYRSARDIEGIFEIVGIAFAAIGAGIATAFTGGLAAGALIGLVAGVSALASGTVAGVILGAEAGVQAALVKKVADYQLCGERLIGEEQTLINAYGPQPCYSTGDKYTNMGEHINWYLIPYRRLSSGSEVSNIYDDGYRSAQRINPDIYDVDFYDQADLLSDNDTLRKEIAVLKAKAVLLKEDSDTIKKKETQIQTNMVSYRNSKIAVKNAMNYCVPIPLGPSPNAYKEHFYFEGLSLPIRLPTPAVCPVPENASDIVDYNEQNDVNRRLYSLQCNEDTVKISSDEDYNSFDAPSLFFRYGFSVSEGGIVPDNASGTNKIYDSEQLFTDNSDVGTIFKEGERKSLKLYYTDRETGEVVNYGNPVFENSYESNLDENGNLCLYEDVDIGVKETIGCVPKVDPEMHNITLKFKGSLIDPMVEVIVWKANVAVHDKLTSTPNATNAVPFTGIKRSTVRDDLDRCPSNTGLSYGTCDCIGQFSCVIKPGDIAEIKNREVYVKSYTNEQQDHLLTLVNTMESEAGSAQYLPQGITYDLLRKYVQLSSPYASSYIIETFFEASGLTDAYLEIDSVNDTDQVKESKKLLKNLRDTLISQYSEFRYYLNVYGLISQAKLRNTDGSLKEPYEITGVNNNSGEVYNGLPYDSMDNRLAVAIPRLNPNDSYIAGVGICNERSERDGGFDAFQKVDAWSLEGEEIDFEPESQNRRLRVMVPVPILDDESLDLEANNFGLGNGNADDGVERDFMTFIRHTNAPQCSCIYTFGGWTTNSCFQSSTVATVTTAYLHEDANFQSILNNIDNLKNNASIVAGYDSVDSERQIFEDYGYNVERKPVKVCVDDKSIYDVPVGYKVFVVNGYNGNVNAVNRCATPREKYWDIFVRKYTDPHTSGLVLGNTKSYFQHGPKRGSKPTAVLQTDTKYVHGSVLYNNEYYYTLNNDPSNRVARLNVSWNAWPRQYFDLWNAAKERRIDTLCDSVRNIPGINSCSCWEYGGKILKAQVTNPNDPNRTTWERLVDPSLGDSDRSFDNYSYSLTKLNPSTRAQEIQIISRVYKYKDYLGVVKDIPTDSDLSYVKKNSVMQIVDQNGNILEEPILIGFYHYIDLEPNDDLERLKLSFGTNNDVNVKYTQGGYNVHIEECDLNKGNNTYAEDIMVWDGQQAIE